MSKGFSLSNSYASKATTQNHSAHF